MELLMQIPELQQYTESQIKLVLDCYDEVAALKRTQIGYNDDEIEQRIGDYLDEIYLSYKEPAVSNHLLDSEDFDYIYSVILDTFS